MMALVNLDKQLEKMRRNLDAADIHHSVVYAVNCMEPDRGDIVLCWSIALNC